MKSLFEITYRDIAKMLVKALPVEGEDFTTKVNEYLEVIKALPKSAKIALKSAYVFSAKVPREEREDLFQDIALTLLTNKTDSERLAYSIARCDWKDWWKKYKIRQHFSLDTVVNDSEGNKVTMGDLVVGESEFELKMNGKLDAQRIWNILPAKLKKVVQAKLLGQMVSPFDNCDLQEWGAKHAMYLS